MAIGTIGSTEGGASARAKINSAIGEANKVASKADQTALTAETTTRAAADAGLQTQLNGKASTSSLTAEVSARSSGDAGLQSQVNQRATVEALATETAARAAGDNARVTYAEAASPLIRPGEANRFFASDMDGSPAAVTPLDDGLKAVSANGSIIALNGAGVVAPLSIWRVEPGRQYRARFVVQRAANTDDPANDAIRLAFRWLKADKSGLSTTILADLLDVNVANGRLEYSFNVASTDAENIDAASPLGAVYVRPFVQVFGSGVTHVEVIEVTDLSLAVDWSPDVSEFRNEIAGLAARVGTFEDQIEMRAEIKVGDGDATGGGAAALLKGDGNFFSIIPTDLLGGFNTLKELYFDPEVDAIWTAKGGFATTGNFTAGGNGTFSGWIDVGDAATSRTNLGVYSTSEVDDAIGAEASARAAADEVLQDNINAEAAARADADDTLQDNIDAEASARAAGDQAINDTYDPTGVEGDAFDMANMVEAADAKVMTAAERAKIGYLTVTQAVDLDTIETRVNALDAAVVLVGEWDASAGTFPGSGAAQAGESWIVTVVGDVDGVEFKEGDRIVALTDNASASTYADNWLKLDYTDRVSAVAGLVGNIDAADLRTAINVADEADNTEAALNAASAKATPVDGDLLGLIDSEASNALKKLNWANVKATLKTYFDTLYQAAFTALTNYTNGFSTTAVDDGTQASGTYTPTPSGGNLRRIVNGGAFTFAAPTQTGDYTLIVAITNDASAGAITFSGFTRQDGAVPTTADGEDFLAIITKINGLIHLNTVAMQ